MSSQSVGRRVRDIGLAGYLAGARIVGQDTVSYTYDGETFEYRYSDPTTYRKLSGCLDSGEIAHEGVPIDCLRVGSSWDAIVDIGAHYGIYAVVLGVLNPDLPLVCFEPNVENRRVLAENLELNGLTERADVRPEVVAGERGAVTFYEDPSEWSVNHTIRPTDAHVGHTATEKVALPLSELLREDGVSRPWVKIDAEGAEYAILKDVFADDGIGDVAGIVELHLDRPGVSIPRMERLLGANGYTWRAVKTRRTETNPGYLFGPEGAVP